MEYYLYMANIKIRSHRICYLVIKIACIFFNSENISVGYIAILIRYKDIYIFYIFYIIAILCFNFIFEAYNTQC